MLLGNIQMSIYSKCVHIIGVFFQNIIVLERKYILSERLALIAFNQKRLRKKTVTNIIQEKR